MEFQDYYATLGVSRGASAEEIRRAYRDLARKTHPDVDQTSGSAERFKRIAEAYEVLKDPETRRRYDALGANWRAGEEFTPPPGFEATFERGPHARRPRGKNGRHDFGRFSSFFETLFGDEFTDGVFSTHAVPEEIVRGDTLEAQIEITLAEALRGGRRAIEIAPAGRAGPHRKLEVTLPPGLSEGSVLRLAGQGQPGSRAPGDLLLHVRIVPDPRFRVTGSDLATRLVVLPHQAVLGARVPLALPDGGEVVVSVPPGSSSGRVLRLRGLGLARRDGSRGDLHAEIAIEVPAVLDESERKLWMELASRAKPA